MEPCGLFTLNPRIPRPPPPPPIKMPMGPAPPPPKPPPPNPPKPPPPTIWMLAVAPPSEIVPLPPPWRDNCSRISASRSCISPGSNMFCSPRPCAPEIATDSLPPSDASPAFGKPAPVREAASLPPLGATIARAYQPAGPASRPDQICSARPVLALRRSPLTHCHPQPPARHSANLRQIGKPHHCLRLARRQSRHHRRARAAACLLCLHSQSAGPSADAAPAAPLSAPARAAPSPGQPCRCGFDR